MDTVSVSISSNPIIDKLSRIVIENLDREDFDVHTFARLSGMCRSGLYRKIKKSTGKSVTEFIRDIRLKKALEYLRTRQFTVCEVSYMVGFHSPTYFNKCFKDKYGFTPGETVLHEMEVDELLCHEEVSAPHTVTIRSTPWEHLWWWVAIIILPLGAWYNLKAPNKSLPVSEAVSQNINNRSIAVLPIKNWTGNEKLDYICYGATNAIISELSRTGYFENISSMHNVLSLKDSVTSSREISEKLGVANILQGSLEQSGNKLKFSVQSVIPSTEEIQWTHDYIIDWEPDETFAMQKHIAEEVIKSLGAKKYARDFWVPEPYLPETTSAKAYELRTRALFQVSKFTKRGWKNGIALYEKAIEEDPDYYQAYRDLAYAWKYGGLIWAYCKQDVAWRNLKKYLAKAMTYNPDNEEFLILLKEGYFYFELNSDPDHRDYPRLKEIRLEDHINDFAKKMGQYHRSIAVLERSLELDPTLSANKAYLAINYLLSGEEEKARKLIDENFEFGKDQIDFLREAAKVYFLLGDYSKMSHAVDTFYATFEERPPAIQFLKAISADNNRNPLERDQVIGALRQAYLDKESGSPAWFLALYYAHNNNITETLVWLQRSYKAREVEMTWLAQEPLLEIVGNHPRYIALLDSMNFPRTARRFVSNNNSL
ncbi:helix-turn-helix domain-containing protein [Robertkochia aurantiaca]|uniref:helix-turn-helix domain-containing protein n=1 Tax=Robertkochia aurantiaca TaxID=2873700 RepID=UPI001CCF7D16|nr:helix-turn-helix domain-containing protein [Robertkochia sp. 3YJGBD-33]